MVVWVRVRVGVTVKTRNRTGIGLEFGLGLGLRQRLGLRQLALFALGIDSVQEDRVRIGNLSAHMDSESTSCCARTSNSLTTDHKPMLLSYAGRVKSSLLS